MKFLIESRKGKISVDINGTPDDIVESIITCMDEDETVKALLLASSEAYKAVFLTESEE